MWRLCIHSTEFAVLQLIDENINEEDAAMYTHVSVHRNESEDVVSQSE